MRRILMIMTVVALMGVMLAVSVAPTLARKPQYSCTDGIRTIIVDRDTANRLEREGATCTRISRSDSRNMGLGGTHPVLKQGGST